MAKKGWFPSLPLLPQNSACLRTLLDPACSPFPVVKALSLWYPILIRTISPWNFFSRIGDLSKALGHYTISNVFPSVNGTYPPAHFPERKTEAWSEGKCGLEIIKSHDVLWKMSVLSMKLTSSCFFFMTLTFYILHGCLAQV